ncbi:putative SOS response-associated peptidase YedK [Pseudomonas nitritireducens]|uniref:Abasic site processing protein n=1 Tax=Pseudomonas nitroreducens TaxID=46680 RepID=A0A7W7KRV3_PSENT|nr:SOS response-associated peptidase family protein [Pseudomonas nitritireducens]MBB4867168.1 putative SOS response-associated peptidase YedK [Pseudomonas nitritireducens]
MCSHYEAPSHSQLKDAFGLDTPDFKQQVFPLYDAPFIRPGDAPGSMEAALGAFGLIPFWAKEKAFGRRTYNARTETVETKPSYRSAWREARYCIIPAAAIYEPDWRSGKAVPTRISRADGKMMGIAGIWERWRGQDGHDVNSFSMLTINADDHDLMRNYHRPDDEKRMVVILKDSDYHSWLTATPQSAREFFTQFPASDLRAVGEPKQG